jgi:hypothetical protein
MFPVLLWQEFLDIPYYWIKNKLTKEMAGGVIIHHLFVILMYNGLSQTPFLMWHVLSYLFHHTIVNIPVNIPGRKWIYGVTWSTQVILPSIFYHRDLCIMTQHWSSLVSYWIIMSLYISSVMRAVVFWFQWKYNMTAFITLKPPGSDDTPQMHRIL